MKNINPHKAALAFALLLLVIAIILMSIGKIAVAGPFLIVLFIILSYAVKGFPAVKGLSFTMWMFTAVCAALFYPNLFVKIGGFETKALITPLLQIIMFGMGSQMSLNDFTGVIKMPKGVVIGVVGHYMIMPLMALVITRILSFPPEIAAGIILVACCPSGLASNVMSLLANANLALAVTIGALTTILAPFITPFLMKIIGGQYVAIDIWKMMFDILNMMIFPIIAGFIFNLFWSGKGTNKSRLIELASYLAVILLGNLIYLKVHGSDFSGYFTAVAKTIGIFFVLPIIAALALRSLLKGNQKTMKEILGLLSKVGIAVIVTVITAAGRDSLLQVGILLLVVVLVHNLAGYALGYGLAWSFKMPAQDCRTIAFEVGMPNAGLASGLAITIGNIATVGLAPAIYGPLMNITGSTLASWWRNNPPKEVKIKEEEKKAQPLK